MNVRVSAIILVAAIFMAVWDADQKGIAKDRLRIARARAAASTVAAADAAQTATTKATTVAAPTAVTAAPVSTTPVPTVSSTPDQCIPLPSRLAAGTWQVVDETGRQTRVTIHSAPQTNPENNFCIVTGDSGRRWCFVRIPEQQTAELPKTSIQQ